MLETSEISMRLKLIDFVPEDEMTSRRTIQMWNEKSGQNSSLVFFIMFWEKNLLRLIILDVIMCSHCIICLSVQDPECIYSKQCGGFKLLKVSLVY